jgi:hypothetical protein
MNVEVWNRFALPFSFQMEEYLTSAFCGSLFDIHYSILSVTIVFLEELIQPRLLESCNSAHHIDIAVAMGHEFRDVLAFDLLDDGFAIVTDSGRLYVVFSISKTKC